MDVKALPVQQHEKVGQALNSLVPSDFDCTQFKLAGVSVARMAAAWENYRQLLPTGEDYKKFEATGNDIATAIELMREEFARGEFDGPGTEAHDAVSFKGTVHHMLFIMKPLNGKVYAAFRLIEAKKGVKAEDIAAYLVSIGAIGMERETKALKYILPFDDGTTVRFTREGQQSPHDSSTPGQEPPIRPADSASNVAAPSADQGQAREPQEASTQQQEASPQQAAQPAAAPAGIAARKSESDGSWAHA